MTPHQLSLLDQIDDGTTDVVHDADRDAVRAILAERDVLLAACEAVLAWLGDDDVLETEPTSLHGQIRAAVAKATGGKP